MSVFPASSSADRLQVMSYVTCQTADRSMPFCRNPLQSQSQAHPPTHLAPKHVMFEQMTPSRNTIPEYMHRKNFKWHTSGMQNMTKNSEPKFQFTCNLIIWVSNIWHKSCPTVLNNWFAQSCRLWSSACPFGLPWFPACPSGPQPQPQPLALPSLA